MKGQLTAVAIVVVTGMWLLPASRNLAAQEASATAAGVAGDPSAAHPDEQAAKIFELIEKLGDRERSVRDAAESELAEFGATARSALETAAGHTDSQIAVRAARLLGRLPRLTHAVVDALGAPIAGATVTVRLVSDADADFSLQETVSFTSDEHGRISIPPLRAGESRAVVDLHHPDYGAGTYELAAHDRERVLRFPLVGRQSEARQRAVTGIVLSPQGRPVAGAAVHCTSVRTPGEGLVNPSYPYGEAVADQDGRFAYYLPNELPAENADRERGELIPANSRFQLSVRVPHDESMFPAAGMYSNFEENTITLRHAARFHAFRFEAAGGGWIEDPQKLQSISVVFEGDPPDSAAGVTLERSAVTAGRRLIPGKYSAVDYFGGVGVDFEPIVVTRESPPHLDFRLPKSVVFRGRVVHGVTGEPLAGAFVIGWSSTARQNLAILSPDHWRGLRKLESNTSIDHPSLAILREHYGARRLVRTDNDGRFEITQGRDEEFYGLMAFDEDFVPFKVRCYSLNTDEPGPVAAGDFPLFPAAKVFVHPVHDGGHLSVSPKWLLEDQGQPEWMDRFRAATVGQDRELEYVHWLRLNEPQPIYVPADVRLRLLFETPYNDEWSPAIVEEPIQLAPRAVHEVGEVRFAAALPAIVRVVDSGGRPVEGVPVRRKYDDGDAWCVAHNTDASGQAYFHVNRASNGTFRVSDIRAPREVAMAENLHARFEIANAPPEQPFKITITDEQKRLLLETSSQRP